MVKVAIFLDIDGVLNCASTKELMIVEHCVKFTGIDSRKVEVLSNIITELSKEYDVDIILSSSWRLDWEKEDKEHQGMAGTYLDEKLKEYDLYVLDKIFYRGSNRGHGIRNYLAAHAEYEAFVVFDDEFFSDYKETSIGRHLIMTSPWYQGGLKYKYINKIKKILKEEDLK